MSGIAPAAAGTTLLALLVIGAGALDAQEGGAAHAHHHHAGAGAPAGALADDFLRAAVLGSARFRDRREAISAGYRRIGPDFPGMGEHWIHLGVLVGGRIDPSRPTFLSYAEIGGAPVLVGVAYAIPLGPDELPPDHPAGRHAWHDHTRSIDDEVLLTQAGVHAHAERPRARLAMLHAWTWLENADGPYAKENWALPFLRAGLEPPSVGNVSAARALSLVTNRAYYDELLAAFGDLRDSERARLHALLDDGAGRVRARLRAMSAGQPAAEELHALAQIWSDLWMRAEAGQSAGVRAVVATLRGG